MASLGSLSVTVGAAIDGFERSMGTVSQRLNAIDREATKAFSGFEKVGDRLTTIGTGLAAAITLPLLGFGTAAVKVAGDFERSFNRVSALGEITGKDLDRLKAQAIDLGAKTAFSAQQAADGMAVFASAGFNAEKIYAAMPGTLSLAAAGQIAIAEAATLTKDVLGQFGYAANQAGIVADVLAQASLDTSANMSELGTTLTYVGPVAHGAGQSLQETTAAIVALDAAGIRGEKAGTGLRGVLGSLLAPSKEAAGHIADLGVKVSDAEGRIRPLSAIMDDFKTNLSRVGSEAERSRIIFEVFGREAGNAAQVLIDTGGPALDAFERKLVNSGGAADRVAKQLNTGFNYQMDQLKGSIETAGIALGTVLLPTVNRALSAFTAFVNDAILPAVNWFGKLPQPIQDIGLGLGLLAAAAGPVVFVMGQLITALATVLPALTSLGGAITTFVTTQAPAMVAGTGTIATALGALSSAAVLTAGVFVGWKLGSWAYEQIPGFKALGDALAESLLVIPGVEAAIRGLSGASAALAVAIDTSEFAIKKQEEALARIGIVLNKEGISTEEYAKRLRETVQQQIEMAKQTRRTDTEVKKGTRSIKDAAGASEDHGKAVKEAALKTREFSNLQPVFAARMRIVEGEYKKNVEELARLQLALERGQIGSLDMSAASEKLAADIGHLGTAIKDLPQLPGFTGRIPELEAVGEAYKRLGITTTGELKRIADAHLADFNTIKGSGIATAKELETAWLKWLEAAADAAHQAGEEIPIELEGILAASEKKTKEGTEKQKTIWQDFGNSVSTVITNFAQDISKSLWDGELSWGEKGKDLLKSLGQSVTSLFIEPATAALSKFITGVLADLFGGKGFGGILDRVKDIGSTVADVFGKAPAGAAPGGGASIPTGGGGGGGVAGAASGIGGTVDIITGAISAAANVVSAIYNVRIEGTLNAIEENTRKAQIVLLDTLGRANEFWPSMRDTHAAVVDLLVPTMRELRDGLKTLFTVSLNLKDSDQQELVNSLLGRVAGPDTLASDRLLDIHARLGNVLSATQDVRKGIVDAIGSSAQLLKDGLAAIEDKLPSTIGSLLGGVGGLAGGISGALGGLVSGLVGALVNRGQGEAIDLIEENSRYTAIGIVGPSGVVASLREFLPFLPDIHERLSDLLDDHAWRIHDVWNSLNQVHDLIAFDTNSILSEIRDSIRAPRATGQLEAAGLGKFGGTINIINPTFRDRNDIDYMLAELRRNL